MLAVVPLLYLLLRRLTMERLRYISTFGDYFAMALLLLVIATGNQMRFMGRLDLAQARLFVSGLLTLHPVPAPSDSAFVAHVLLVCALLIYIPFSKLVHLGGLAFSPTLNQTNNPRERRYA
jgi:nitrate reductase gamma subunit